MKAYVMKVLVIDHEGWGPVDCLEEVLQSKYLSIIDMGHEQYDIGEWTDEHPLNQYGGHAWLDALEAEVV